MARNLRFTSPEELHAFVEQHSPDTDTDIEEIHVEIALAQPLSDPSYLPPQKITPSAHKHTDELKYVTMSDLATSWRREWAPFVKKIHARLTLINFDNTLPTCRDHSGVERKIYWDRGASDPERGEVHFTASTDRYFALIILLATQARMIKSRGLKFVTPWEGADMKNDSRWKGLGKRLEKLST